MSQKPHLDDFFRAARREEPVISREELGELIDARRSETTTQHINWKGIGMTTFGFGLAAVLSYFTFFASPDELPQTASQSAETGFQRSEILPQNSVLPTQAQKPQLSSKLPRLATVETRETPRTPAVEAPIKIDEMKITEPREDDMKRLGMKVDGGREVVVVQKVGKKFFIVSFGAQPFKVSSELEEVNPTDIEPTDVLPVFVTNLDGTGILTANAPNENTTIVTKEEHRTNDGENTIDRTKTVQRTNIVKIERDHTDGDEPDIDIDSKIELNYNLDSVLSAAYAGSGTASARAKVVIQHDDDDIVVDASEFEDAGHEPKNVHKEVRIAVNDGGENSHAIRVEGLDSSRKKIMIARLSADSMKSHMKELQLDLEALKANLESVAKDLKLKINDSSVNIDIHQMMDEMRQSMKELSIESKREGRKGRALFIKPGDMKVRAQTFVMPSFSELKAKVSELVPMRVALNEDKGRGLIFWYEPSVASVETRQEMQSVAASSLKDITINPNPARDRATVRFTVTAGHIVSMSVHDILGKRLIEAGQIPVSEGREMSTELDLSSLEEGVYLVVLTSDSGERHIERILVNK